MVEYKYESEMRGRVVAFQNTQPPKRMILVRLDFKGAIVLLLKDLVDDICPIRARKVRINFHESHNLTQCNLLGTNKEGAPVFEALTGEFFCISVILFLADT